MNQEDLERLQLWFDAFTASFCGRDAAVDDAVQLKREHTRRVQAEIRLLARDLQIVGHAHLLALAVAMLHDVGRFEQFAQYHTFDDARSTDHAELGSRILHDGKVQDWIAGEARDVLLDAVHFHSRVRLPAIEEPLRLQTCQMVRDADKLDIWAMVIADYRHFKAVPDAPFYRGLARQPGISEGVRADVYATRPVSFAGVKKLNDYVVLQAAMAFDVNYAPTFRRIHQRDILPAIRSMLPPHDASIDEEFGGIGRYAARMAGAPIASAYPA